jgi:hypothetical protein
VANGLDSGPKALPGPFSLPGRVRLSWSRPGGSFRVRHDSADRFVNPGEREYGDIMACTVRDTSC